VTRISDRPNRSFAFLLCRLNTPGKAYQKTRKRAANPCAAVLDRWARWRGYSQTASQACGVQQLALVVRQHLPEAMQRLGRGLRPATGQSALTCVKVSSSPGRVGLPLVREEPRSGKVVAQDLRLINWGNVGRLQIACTGVYGYPLARGQDLIPGK
jgi:hypothetical protein